jgi:hypothetical protein
MQRVLRLTSAFLALGVVAAPAAASRTYFVNPGARGGGCSDARSAAKASHRRTPWCSIRRAVSATPSGATVQVRGTHPELELDRAPRRGAAITFRATQGAQIEGLSIKAASGLRFKGFRISGPVRLEDAQRIALVENDLDGQPVWLDDTTGVRVERNHIHDIPPGADAKIGIRLMGDRRTVIRGNRIENLVEDPIQVTGAVDVVITNNRIRNAHPADGEHTDAIQVLGVERLTIRGNVIRDVEHGLMFTDAQPSDVSIVNNVFAAVSGTALKADGTHGMPQLRLVNNTFDGHGLGVLLRTRHPDGVVANNIFGLVDGLEDQPIATNNLIQRPRRGVAYGDRAIRRAPRFTDDRSLTLAPGSPGVDAGSSVYAPRTDRVGRARADDPKAPNVGNGRIRYVDVGAHERSARRPRRR